MNHTKEFARTRDGLSHFLTYADNNAVGYFEKQGFSKTITLEPDRWVGFIKDYDGGTLMQCVLHPKLPYANLPGMIRQQQAALDARIRQLSNSHVVHPGLAAFDEAAARVAVPPREAAEVAAGMVMPRRRGLVAVPIETIPGVKEAGWTAEMAADVCRPPYRLLLLPPGVGTGGGSMRDAAALAAAKPRDPADREALQQVCVGSGGGGLGGVWALGGWSWGRGDVPGLGRGRQWRCQGGGGVCSSQQVYIATGLVGGYGDATER